MNIQVDLGNIWEMLSAIGTIGAVIVSLYLAQKNDMQKVNVSFDWGYVFSDDEAPTEIATITVTNVGNPPVTINQVGLKHSKSSDRRMALVRSNDVFDNKLPVKLESSETKTFGLAAENFRKLFLKNEPSHKIAYAYAQTTTGRFFYSKKKYRIV